MLSKQYHESQAFDPNTNALKNAWEINKEPSIEPIAYELCIELLKKKNPQFEIDTDSLFFMELSYSEVDNFIKKTGKYASDKYQPSAKEIGEVIDDNKTLLSFVGISIPNENDLKNINEEIKKHLMQGKNILESLSLVLTKKYNSNADKPTSFADFSYHAVNINAKLIQDKKISSVTDLMQNCAKQRGLIASILKQKDPNYLLEKRVFGIERSLFTSDPNNQVITLMTGRYSDQLSRIKERLIDSINNKAKLTSYSSMNVSGVSVNINPDMHSVQKSTLPLTLKNINLENNTFFLLSAKNEDVNKVLNVLDKYSLEDLQKMSDKELFESLGSIYFAIADACPFLRGTASIAQMTIFSILKNLGKPLVPFSKDIKINPDILVSLIPEEEYKKTFYQLFDRQIFSQLYDLDQFEKTTQYHPKSTTSDFKQGQTKAPKFFPAFLSNVFSTNKNKNHIPDANKNTMPKKNMKK